MREAVYSQCTKTHKARGSAQREYTAMKKVGYEAEIRKFLRAASGAIARAIAEAPVAELASLDTLIRREAMTMGARAHAFAAEKAAMDQAHDSLPLCRECGEAMAFKQNRPTRIRSVLGGRPEVASGPYFLCRDCGVGRQPLREALGLDVDGFTPALREMSILAGVIEPFESAAEQVLSTIGGVSVSGSKVHTLCEGAGDTALELLEQGEVGDARALHSGERLVVEIDGGMLRVDKEWREAKLAIAYPQHSAAWVSEKRREVLHRRCAADIGPPEALRDKLFAMAEPFLPKDTNGAPIVADRIHIVADGAPWIENLVADVFPGATMVLDWYHVVEHVADATRAAYANQRQRKRMTTIWLNQIKSGDADSMLRSVARAGMSQAAGTAAQTALADLHRYLHTRRHLLEYSKTIAQGLPVGSGAAESAIKHVLQLRMKRPGMRWTLPGARRMAALRCAYRSTGGLAAVHGETRRVA